MSVLEDHVENIAIQNGKEISLPLSLYLKELDNGHTPLYLGGRSHRHKKPDAINWKTSRTSLGYEMN